jgi:hypothetical protein
MPAGGGAHEKMYWLTFAARSQFAIIFDMIDSRLANGWISYPGKICEKDLSAI